MIIEIGHFSVIVALVLSVFGMASAALALKTRNPDWGTIRTHGRHLDFCFAGHRNAGLGLFVYRPGFFSSLRRE